MSDRLIAHSEKDGKVVDIYEPSDREIEVVVDGVSGLYSDGPIVKINFHRIIPNPNEPDHLRYLITTRMVMGVDTFLSLSEWMSNCALDMQKMIKEAMESENAES